MYANAKQILKSQLCIEQFATVELCSTPAKHLLQMQPCDFKIRFTLTGSMDWAKQIPNPPYKLTTGTSGRIRTHDHDQGLKILLNSFLMCNNQQDTCHRRYTGCSSLANNIIPVVIIILCLRIKVTSQNAVSHKLPLTGFLLCFAKLVVISSV